MKPMSFGYKVLVFRHYISIKLNFCLNIAMSEEEIFEDDINNEVEDDDGDDGLIKQELIALVKANPALYAKNWKEYAGKNFSKDLAWEMIGSRLSRQMSGVLHMYHLVCLHVMIKLG